MRHAIGQVKMSGTEKIKANMNTGKKKSLVSTYDNYSIKIMSNYGVLVVQTAL